MNPGMKRFALLENLYLVGSPPTRSIDVEIIAAAGSVRLAKIGRPRQLGNLFRAQGADEQLQLTRDYFDALAAGALPEMPAAAA